MNKIMALIIGGAAGTLLRFWVSGWAQRMFAGVFPWGTLTVNLLGSFLIGFFWGIFERGNISNNIRLFLFIGVFGGFTTFSTFALESLNLFKTGHVKFAIIYILASNILGLLFVYLGYILARWIAITNR